MLCSFGRPRDARLELGVPGKGDGGGWDDIAAQRRGKDERGTEARKAVTCSRGFFRASFADQFIFE
jgi:hypothetical protein